VSDIAYSRSLYFLPRHFSRKQAPRKPLACRVSVTMQFSLALLLLSTSASAHFIDPSTLAEHHTTKSFVSPTATYKLIMSDEFATPLRTFEDGHDTTWTAMDRHDDDVSATGQGSLHFYNSSMVNTNDGWLNISTTTGDTTWSELNAKKGTYDTFTKNYRSGMVNSWNKFCFTGGIVEISAVMPGSPSTAGLWPAMWLLGNLGRATYEASTNKIWPWSFDKCDRDLQPGQAINACNKNSHWGMIPGTGRGATEIDVLEIMPGKPGYLPSTIPKIERPYGAMTLQVAPGIPAHRPQGGSQPMTKGNDGHNGFAPTEAQIWYKDLERHGNTSINPFFYGTYLAETKPEEPVHRTKKEAYQADAVGAIFQLSEVHFQKAHKYRLEWQPGSGGRIDWYVEDTQPDARSRGGDAWPHSSAAHNSSNAAGGDEALPLDPTTPSSWIHAFSIVDKSLKDVTEAQIPQEPSYLIFNTAVSSTWGFPYDTPATCKKCYDCADPACACAIPPGFCDTLKPGLTSMLIDYIRVYQTTDDDAHVGQPHTQGCDPVDHPTREYIKGHESVYMRSAPFVDEVPIKPVRRGGGKCESDADCGLAGKCSTLAELSFWSSSKEAVCKCHDKAFTGPRCLSLFTYEDEAGAYDLNLDTTWFLSRFTGVYVPMPLVVSFSLVAAIFIGSFVITLQKKKLSSGSSYSGLQQQEMTPRPAYMPRR